MTAGFDIWHEVPLVPQLTGMSCWAAAAAMVVGWRDCLDVRPEEVARGAGRWEAYRRGLAPADIDALASAFDLTILPARRYRARDLRDLLERHGPLWVGEAVPGLHVVVVTGVYGSGAAHDTWVRVADPWPVGRGERYRIPFAELAANLEAASDVVGIHAQILHAGGRRSQPRSTFSEALPMQDARIVIDPGHGGHMDAGTSSAFGVRGADGTLEKDFNLRLAHLVARRLGTQAELTRQGDQNLPLGARAELARRVGAEVFLSLHANDGGGRGPEAWVHERAGATSELLARSLQGRLARFGSATHAVRRGPMAVLTPERHAAGTAACLLEVDQLARPAAELEGLADSIAAGVRGYLGGRYGEGYAFDDVAELDQHLRNARAGDTLAVSTVDEALHIIAGFRSSGAGSAWRTLDRHQVANRLETLVRNPGAYQQGRHNLCGPAAFLSVWTKRDPVALARFATELYDTGRSHIGGSFPVAPRDSLLHQDYAAMRARMGRSVTEQADWMLMGALRNNDDCLFVWEGDPEQQVAGITFPEEVVDWLNATGLYERIDNRIGNSVSALSSKGYPAAQNIELYEGTDVICLIQANMVAEQIGAGRDDGFLRHFSNHYVVLNAGITTESDTGPVHFNIWSFGRDFATTVATVRIFGDNYFGSIVARLRR